jgi:hypothetical protein
MKEAAPAARDSRRFSKPRDFLAYPKTAGRPSPSPSYNCNYRAAALNFPEFPHEARFP